MKIDMIHITLQQAVFCFTALFIAVCSVMTVTTGRILRSATYLLFVLFGTAAVYFLLGYTFLGAVQLMVYAGGIVVLYVFSILLTQSDKSMNRKLGKGRLAASLITVAAGVGLTAFLVLTNGFSLSVIPEGTELGVREIGLALMGSGKGGYILPFEAISILLLACMVGGLAIARKEKGEK